MDAQDRLYVDQYDASPVRADDCLRQCELYPHKLLPGSEIDYNVSFSYDDRWVVFTSERGGSPDMFRARVDGTALEQLTDAPAFDDQAAVIAGRKHSR